jgi:hypothetical protein
LKKEIFDEYGTFDEGLKNVMDYDLWLRLLKVGVQAHFLNEIICYFIIREDAQSAIGRQDDENNILYKRYINNYVIIKMLYFWNKAYKLFLNKMSVYKL